MSNDDCYTPPHRLSTIEPFRYIHRLHMKNNDNQISFEDRFEFDYMGAREFERDWVSQRISELNTFCDVGEVMVDGVFMLTAYHRHRTSLLEVERTLNRLYHGELQTKERTNFNRQYRRLERERRWTNSWFEIETGVFWTWERCNISDIRKNFARSVMATDDKARREIHTAGASVTYDPLRQKLIDSGILHPART